MKLADNQKGKVAQTQIPLTMVPVHLPMSPGYPQPGNSNVSYTYPHLPVATYPTSAYPIPSPAAAAPPYGPYTMQPQISYSAYSVQKEPVVPSPTPPAGIGSYPYYYPNNN